MAKLYGRHPFSRSVDLTPTGLNVLRDLIRQVKSFDEIVDSKPLIHLGDQERRQLWDSDVVKTIVDAEMPATLAMHFENMLMVRLDRLIFEDRYKQEEVRAQSTAYADNPTFGMF